MDCDTIDEMCVYDKIKKGFYDTATVKHFKKRCVNGHSIPHNADYDFCPKCGEEVKNFNIMRKESHIEALKNTQLSNNKIMEKFKKDALEYCDLLEHEKADIAYQMAWERGHSTGLSTVVDELEDLSELLN